MGEETFNVYELIKQKGDDGLPRHLIQIDIEDGNQKHLLRIFVPVAELKQLLFENGI